MKKIMFGLGLAAVMILGCTRVYVPATPEGQACVRECMIVRNTCTGDSLACTFQQKSCLRSCPGAVEK